MSEKNTRSINPNQSTLRERDISYFPQLIYPPPPPPEDDTIDLIELVQKLWLSRRLILGVTIATLLCAIGYLGALHVLGKRVYEVSVTYEPLYGDVGRINGFLKTRKFLTYFLEQEGLVPIILADLYDPNDQTYRLPNNNLAPAELAATRLIGDEKDPTFKFENVGNFRRLIVNYPDPETAARLANQVLLRGEEYLRADLLEDANLSLERNLLTFSNLGLTKKSLIEGDTISTPNWQLHENVLSGLQERLVESEVRLRILEQTSPEADDIPKLRTEIEVVRERLPTWEERSVRTQQENAEAEPETIAGLRIALAKLEAHIVRLNNLEQPLLRIIDPAIVPDEPSNPPKTLLILVLAGMVGLFGSFFLIFLLDFINKVREQQKLDPKLESNSAT